MLKLARRAWALSIVGLISFLATGISFDAPALADTAPTVTIAQTSTVSYTAAGLSGTVNPNGGPSITSWHFEYSTNPAEGWTPAGGGELTQTESEGHSALLEKTTLEGLSPNTTYEVRLVAANEGGPGESGEPYPTFTTKEITTKPTVTLATISTFTATTAHFSGTVNPNAPGAAPQDPAFNTAWRFTCSPECPGLEGSVPADDSAHTVTAEATGLRPGTIYVVALEATDLGGTELAGPEVFTTPAVAPTIATESESASEVTASSATLGAEVNPGGAEASYRFDYGTSETYDQSTPETSLVGNDNSDHPATAHLQGLAPATTYHYRIVVTNGVGGPREGPDGTFTTEPAGESFRLPDGRAYELVSPEDKNGGDVVQPYVETGIPGVFVGQSGVSDSESSVAFLSATLFGVPAQGAPLVDHYVAVRGADGWATRGVNPAQEPTGDVQVGISPEFFAFSADLSKSLFFSPNPVPGTEARAQQENLYLRNEAGEYRVLTPGGGPEPAFGGASADWSHLIFSSFGAYTANATSGEYNLYEWIDGKEQLVNILPDGSVDHLPDASSGFGKGGSTGSKYAGINLTSAISEDGSRVYWTDLDHGQALYLREINSVGDARTVQVDESKGGPSGSGNGLFMFASRDGKKAFFTDQDQLTANATSGENCGVSDLGPRGDLYEFEEQAGGASRLTDLTTGDAHGACVLAVLGGSEDGSIVYFVATGDLASGGVGARNLYVHEPDPEHPGQSVTKFIAALTDTDVDDWGERAVDRNVSVTPDGQQLAFMSTKSLQVGYDNSPVVPEDCIVSGSGGSPGPCSEVYLYDAGGRSGKPSLTCVSCDQTGARPSGNSILPVALSELYVPRYLSSDGRRLFFDSTDALAPGDTNGTWDVYEWEAQGEGSCVRVSGCVFPISGGTSPNESLFLDATPSGDNVFFTTRQQLVAGDQDEQTDLYDARVGGGFPQAPVLACSGTGCQGVPAAPPLFATPSSATFAGVGNFAPQGPSAKKAEKKTVRCAKARKLSHGKCTKREAKSRKRAKAKRANYSRRASR